MVLRGFSMDNHPDYPYRVELHDFLVDFHCDGENRRLMTQYPSCGFDVSESVCPTPMTHSSLTELRAGMGPHITIWGGIPAVALLDKSMDDTTFEAYLDELFAYFGTGERLILGVSDNVPPDSNLLRLGKIKERVEAFGPVRSSNVGWGTEPASPETEILR